MIQTVLVEYVLVDPKQIKKLAEIIKNSEIRVGGVWHNTLEGIDDGRS